MSRLTTCATSGTRNPGKSRAANCSRASATVSVCSGGSAARRSSSIWIWGSTGISDHLEQACCSHAAADAHRHHNKPCLAAPAFDEDMADHAGTRHTVGVADGNRPAIDVELLRIDPEPVAAVQHLAGEGLVQLPQVDVLDPQTVLLQQLGDGEDRADAHLVGCATGHGHAAIN